MKGLKSHFVFNKSERNGIFLLVVLIVVAQTIYFLIPFSEEDEVSVDQLEEIRAFQNQVDSLKRVALSKDSVLYPFNPNFISDYKGYTLGMSVEEIDRLHAYRAQDKWVNSVADFQRVTGVSDSLLQVISVSFRFPEWVSKQSLTGYQRTEKGSGAVEVQDLNKVTAEDLKGIYGIGEVLSARIVKYRESIGGFVHNDQLYDVYGLDHEVGERVLQRFRVEHSLEVEKRNLNTISLLHLSEIPGVGYELARDIIKYREDHNGFQAIEELLKIKDFPPDKLGRIKLYLTIDKDIGTNN